MKILIIARRVIPLFPYMFTRTWQGMVLSNSKPFGSNPKVCPAGAQQDVFSAAQKDLSSPKSLAVHADNLTSKVGKLIF